MKKLTIFAAAAAIAAAAAAPVAAQENTQDPFVSSQKVVKTSIPGWVWIAGIGLVFLGLGLDSSSGT